MKGWIPGLCLVLAAGSQALASSQSHRAHGAAVFAANGCGHCHTINKVGGHKGPELSGVGRVMSKTKIREQILHGGNEMPPFTDDLGAVEVNDLVAYLRSCRQKPIKK